MNAPSLRPGSVIDGYEVVDLLGRGGMGAVYRVRRGDSVYALKTLALAVDDDSEEVVRFRREAELLGSLRHPGLVNVSSAGNKPGFFYFVMRLIDGESLEDRLKRTGPLPAAEATRIALAVADAIAHAHERGIVHRDLKPANILMEGDGDRPVVTDFGLGRRLGESEAERLTRTGEILGTPSFVAPEQAFGTKAELDEKTDIYGLGALLYAMLSGHPPYDGPSALVVMKKVSTEMPAPLAGVSPELESFVLRAMAKRREDRPSSARAFIDELHAAATKVPLVSRTALALLVFALVLLAGTVTALGAWRSQVVGLAPKVATLRSQLDAEPLPAARATAASALSGIPFLVRGGFVHERSARARSAFAAGSWDEAREAALDCWLAAPEPPRDVEAILVASLLEVAAARELCDRDAPAAARLRELARTAPPETGAAARNLLLELLRARTLALIAAVSTSAEQWTPVLQHSFAALHATSSETLPEDAEQARVAALVLSGRSADPRLLAARSPGSLRAPPLSLAVRVLYDAALALPETGARREALVRLEKVPPPPPLDAVVSDLWWRAALEEYEAQRIELPAKITALYAEIADAKSPDKNAQATEKATVLLARILDPLGRAFLARPDREPLPEELGELTSLIRLVVDQNILLGPRCEGVWKKAIATLGDHPIALYVRGRLLANRDLTKRRAVWPRAWLAELHAFARQMRLALEHAPRTAHVRVFALQVVTRVLLDEELEPPFHEGTLDDATPLLELADYSESWGTLAFLRTTLGDAAGVIAANKAWAAHEAVKNSAPSYLTQLAVFLEHHQKTGEGPR